MAAVRELKNNWDKGPLYQGPMIDAHSHVGPRGHPPDLLLAIIEEARLERVVLCTGGGGPPDLPREFWERAPGRVIPFVVKLSREPGTGKVIFTREDVDYIRQAMESGWPKGIGGLSLRHKPYIYSSTGYHVPADQPLLLEIYDLAVKHGVPVEIHFEFKDECKEELDRAFGHNRQAKIIWEHFGDASPRVLREMLAQHPNLYADLSNNSPVPGFYGELAPADSEGNFKPDWKALFLEFPDRFLFGIDMGGREERYRNGPQVVRYYRKVLGQLPAAVAERIAYKNILGLLPADVRQG